MAFSKTDKTSNVTPLRDEDGAAPVKLTVTDQAMRLA
jgi:hypothetical protein